MKKIVLLFSCAVALVSCKSKDAFILSGEVQNPNSIKKVFLIETDSTAITVVDSAALSDQNKFSFKHVAPYPTLYKLKVGGTMFDMIAKNGDNITFKTNATDTTNAYTIGGSDESVKIQEFNKLSNHYTQITDKITADYNYKVKTLHQDQATTLAASIVLFKQNQKAYSEATLKFMKDNESSLAGYFASTSLDPVAYESQLITYSDAIKDKFPTNVPVQQFVKKMNLAKPLSIGHKAPEFAIAADIDGKPVKLADYKGKYLMIDFWASWCAPCRGENPNVVKQYALYKDKGLNILGISLDEKKDAWQQAIAADKLTWRQASEFQNFNSPTVRLYGVEAIPSNFIIGPDGNIIAKNITGADLEEFFNKTFNKSNL